MEYVIRPIPLTRGMRDLSQYTYRLNAGVPCQVACYSWYLENSEPKTLIDPGDTSRIPGEAQIQTLENGLKDLGLRPRDIKQIIITHLHLDHINLANLFPHATFYVQRKEWEYAMNPHPLDAGVYRKEFLEGVNFHLLDGEVELMPGIRLVPTPGHTPGGQSVVIDTSEGPVVLSAVCGRHETFEKTGAAARMGWEASIPLIHEDIRECYDSVLKIRSLGRQIIADHDPCYIERKHIP